VGSAPSCNVVPCKGSPHACPLYGVVHEPVLLTHEVKDRARLVEELAVAFINAGPRSDRSAHAYNQTASDTVV
jgi:hypothetical protein